MQYLVKMQDFKKKTFSHDHNSNISQQVLKQVCIFYTKMLLESKIWIIKEMKQVQIISILSQYLIN